MVCGSAGPKHHRAPAPPSWQVLLLSLLTGQPQLLPTPPTSGPTVLGAAATAAY